METCTTIQNSTYSYKARTVHAKEFEMYLVLVFRVKDEYGCALELCQWCKKTSAQCYNHGLEIR